MWSPTRPNWPMLTLGALIVLALFTFPIWRPILLPEDVFDPFPAVSGEEHAILLTMEPTQAAAIYRAGTPVPVPDEFSAMPEMVNPRRVLVGFFDAIDAVRWARGMATIYEDDTGYRLLRLEGFEARNGPDLHVLLSMHPAPRTPDEVMTGMGAIDLGRLVGSVGNQNYEVPRDIDLSQYHSIVIYSAPLEMVFSSAELSPSAQEE